MKPSINEYTYAGFVDFKGYEKAMKAYRTDKAFPWATATMVIVVVIALFINMRSRDNYITAHGAEIVAKGNAAHAAQAGTSFYYKSTPVQP